MVSALGQADSFNSSGATIIPDRNEDGSTRYMTRNRLAGSQRLSRDNQNSSGNGTRQLQGLPSLVAQARLLMPEDSLGRELEAMVRGSGNGNGDDGAAHNEAWIFNREATAPPVDLPSASSQPLPEMSFSQLLDIPSSPPGQSTDINLSSDQDIVSRLQAIIGNNDAAAYTQTNPHDTFEIFRPSSAHSHSASEYSYSSTDVDNDSVMSENSFALQPTNGNATDLGFGGMNLSMNNANTTTTTTNHFWMDSSHNQAVSGGSHIHGVKREAEWERLETVAPSSVSPPEQSSSGRVTSGSPEKEDESSRAAKLEHRRHINRKSAQKHRKRRKEEIEIMTQRVAERDHKITRLEQELAIEKAKNVQLVSWLKHSGYKPGSNSET